MEELREPKFMREIHRIRMELSEMAPAEYERYLEEVRKRYTERLGYLYINLPIVKTEQK